MIRRIALSAALCLSLAGCGALPHVLGAEPATAISAPATTSLPQVVPPARVSIPSLGVESSLIPTLKNPDGTAQVPPVEQPLQASYLDWADSIELSRPLVVYGHINGLDGRKHVPGIFAKLATIKPGAVVDVTLTDRSVEHFRITRVEQRPKDAFPTAEVYDPVAKAEIRLITCDGAFDSKARSYVDNFIAYGELITT